MKAGSLRNEDSSLKVKATKSLKGEHERNELSVD